MTRAKAANASTVGQTTNRDSTSHCFLISIFSSKTDNKPKRQSITWEKLLQRIQNPVIRMEKDGDAFAPAVFDPPRRAKENATELALLVLDYDDEASWTADLVVWRKMGIRFAAHTSHSHQRSTEDHPTPGDRFRVIIPLSEPIKAADFPHLWQWASKVSSGKIDPSAKDVSRLFFKPAKAADDAPYDCFHQDGPLLDWRGLSLSDYANSNGSKNGHRNGFNSPPDDVKVSDKSNAYGQAALQNEIVALISTPIGARNDCLNKAAYALGQLIAGGELDETEVIDRLTAAARAIGLTDEEITPTLRSGLSSGMQEPRSAPEPKKKKTKKKSSDTSSAPAEGSSQIAGQTFELREDGVWLTDPDKSDRWICSPLEIVADTCDERGEHWGRLVRFTDRTGAVKQWAMPCSLLAGDGSAYREQLLDMGWMIAGGQQARNSLALYLNTRTTEHRTCIDRTGWHHDAYVLPDETIGDKAEKLVFQTTAGANHLLRVSGELEEWQSEIGRYCPGNSLLVLCASASFAAALIGPCEVEGGGLHLCGLSSLGKSTALAVAGSIWGGGGERGFLRTWRATSNGLEAVAAYHNHALLILDEMGECDPHVLGETVYMLVNGGGKIRQSRNIALRRQLEWRLLFLSSGEISLSDHLAQIGRRARAGQEVRIVNLEADAGAGAGIFEELHGFTAGDKFADHLTAVSRRIYGSPIRAFLREVVDDRKTVVDSWRSFAESFTGKHVPAGAAGEVSRVARRFAILAYAGELATSMGITSWPEGEALEAAARHFNRWLERRETTGAGDEVQAVRQVKEFLERHGRQRFQSLLTTTSLDGEESWVPTITTNRAGFVQPNADGSIDQFYVLPSIFEREVCAGYDPRIIAKTLASRGWLKTEGGRLQVKVRTPEGRPRCYCISSSILE